MTSERGRPDLEAPDSPDSPDLDSPDLESPKGPQETVAPEDDDLAGESPGSFDTSATEDDDALDDDMAAAREALAELTADLQRLQAEFLNYKRRVERDRDLVRQNAVFTVLTPMLDVLDSIDRARESGELEGGFKGVAEQLERIVNGLGLSKFGEPGDPFDPTRHEALSHVGVDPEVDVVTCKHIAKSGYRIGDRVVRAAQVLVVDPAPED